MKYFKRIIKGPYSTEPDDWYRGHIFRALDDNEYLEEYIKVDRYKLKWGFDYIDMDKTSGPWFKSQYYSKFAGTGKGNAFKEITEKEAFVELL